ELAERDLPLEAQVVPMPARGGEELVRRLFEPLGWSVNIQPIAGPAGASSAYVHLRLSGRARLSALLNHLFLLIPVPADGKHYWVGDDEVTKLLQRGAGWLERHPARELIVARYLVHRRSLARAALARLVPETADDERSTPGEGRNAGEAALEAPIRLNDRR